MSESEVALKFANATVENFNKILSKNNINNQFDIESLSIIYDKLIDVIGVDIDKQSSNYEKTKKNFGKFLNYNYKLLKNSFEIDEEIIQLFKNGPNNNWYLLHLSMVSYLSYIKQIENTEMINKFNIKGMIDKLMIEIEEFTDSEDMGADSEEESNNISYITDELDSKKMLDELNKQLPKSEGTPKLMKGLIGDIKDILSNGNDIKSSSIVDISRNLSDKYQTMIDKGDVNIGDLLSGVFGILNDPESLNGEFDDINADNLPDPNSILADMANDPKLKEAMNMMGPTDGMPNMGMFGSMMANMMGNNSVDNKSISDLEREIEQMMKEVQEAQDAETEQSNVIVENVSTLDVNKLN